MLIGQGQHSQLPIHPIPQLQGPFDESIIEAVEGTEDEWVVDIDAQSRRRDLLENSQYHPFWKLTSQMSFGVYLLTKRIAKSEVEVMKILQSHVDEMDGFLERTTDDFTIIQIDVRTRIQYLSLPLENLDIFDEMLDDRNFRHAMIDYNDKIEHAIGRFKSAVKDSLKDIQKGKEAIGVLWHYIGQSAKENSPLPNNLNAVYNAMLANTEGWNIALSKLRRRGKALGSALLQLGLVVTEMQRRVGVASRKDVVSFTPPPKRLSRSRSIKERLFEKGSLITITSCSTPEKPLPRDPDPVRAANILSIPRQAGGLGSTRKSVTDLRTINESKGCGMDAESPSRAKSVNHTTHNAGSNTVVPKLQRNLSRKISMSMLPKRSVNDKFEAVQNRPATAPSRTLKSRSVSLEQLKSLRTNRKTQKKTVLESPMFHQPEPHSATHSSTRQEKIKDQLSHYFKSDRVIDAWESTARNEEMNCHQSAQKKKDWPLSIFRAKSSNALHGPGGNRTTALEQDLQRQMTWLQEESEALKTYSLKPKCDVAPRIHIFSVDAAFSEEEEEYNDDKDGSETVRGETGSIITALPSVPPPTSSTPNEFCTT
ncbi:hypothetical protein ASPWEDRAFT_110312 [Aspergillus wentii DTO 134E9]|uniref:Uncharacterized protein n=1 Tax=Aspergillus wentii DTO 134E9 TaxID=1073089 RepID=A0A1L9RLE0_ASPWE|nr:uncharacterized protein ASPWEDRAFT_110312 [Aspergillus wentii DTO 134E9]OJJ35724.1 hypothetical protein ASPWEDRAFT_110312 [Aspergillus wentii DTO 134E9]